MSDEVECRIYFRELIHLVLEAGWQEVVDADQVYMHLFRLVNPRPGIRECWMAISGGYIDVSTYDDSDDVYDFLESYIRLCEEVLVRVPLDKTPPDWPRETSTEASLKWLEDICSCFGLASFANALASGVPISDVLEGL